MKAKDLFTIKLPSEFEPFFDPSAPAWEWVRQIEKALGGRRYIDPTAQVHPTAVIDGAVYLGPGVKVGPFAYLRGNVIALEGAQLGHAGEFKNCFLLQKVQAAHYNYVGDSVLGVNSHLAAGSICANFRLDKQPIKLPDGGSIRKLGALIGDDAQVGCNAVLMPGTILGRGAIVHPLTKPRGVVKEKEVVR
jgi:bifunctional N-acetylglucosamine-1-phosphate-uridyltransferase/glucosamine-1-phosphate-acetyltransferase GlmU-like protein